MSQYFGDGEEGTYCPCGCGLKAPQELLEILDKVREEFGYPIYLEQTVTCLEYSLSIDRKETSEHITNESIGKLCRAVDIKSKTYTPFTDWREGRKQLEFIAFKYGAKGFGIGINGDRRLHLDWRPNYAEWYY